MPQVLGEVKINHPVLIDAGFPQGAKVIITPILAERDTAIIMKQVKTGELYPNGKPITRIEIDVLQPKGSYVGATIINSAGKIIDDKLLYNLIGNYSLSQVFTKH
jgi:hypothetical protein